MKRTHSKRITPPARSAKELSGRAKQTSLTGGKRKKHSTTIPTTNPSDTLNSTPPFPPEISDNLVGKRYWKKYWSYLISRGQAVPDFIPTITSLCMLRIQLDRLYIALDNTGPLSKNAIAGQKNLITMARNITALESEHGFTLATHSISQSYDPKGNSKDDTPKSTNTLANRETHKNPYNTQDSELFDDDDPQT